MSSSGDVGQGRRRARPGAIHLAVGLSLLLATAIWTGAVGRSTLAEMFGLVASYAFAALVILDGVMRLRDTDRGEVPVRRPAGADLDAGWVGDPGRRSLRCRLIGHREVFLPRTAERPPRWQCRRCGASSRNHLTARRGWLCQIPLVEHRYVHVGATQDHPEHWRCQRCGRRRYTRPTSAGETLDATRSATMWIRRDHDS